MPARLAALVAVTLAAAPLRAQVIPGAPRPLIPGAPATTTAAQPKPQAVVTRADLALAYTSFDRAWTEHPPAQAARAALSQRFDQATLAFFAGRNADAVRTIHAVTHAVLAPGAGPAISPNVVRASVVPAAWRRGSSETPELRLVPLYARSVDTTAAPVAVEARVRLLSDGGRAVATRTVPIPADAPVGVPIALPLAEATTLIRGRYRVMVELTAPSGVAVAPPSGEPAAHWYVTDDDLDERREEFLRRAAALDTALPQELADAVASFRARARLVTSRPSPNSTAQVRANPLTLVRDLDNELAFVAGGSDPWVRHVGDLWRVIRTPKRDIPLRVRIPVTAARTSEPAPLLIAIHGVGGDENMFPDALGMGRLAQLAEQAGAILASPNGDQFGTPEDLDNLIATVVSMTPVDRRRIWIVGHSRGAGQALALGRARPTEIAAIACIAGFGALPADATVPATKVWLGEVDPLAAPARLEPVAKAAAQAGKPVEVEVRAGLGHTTVVSEVLADAMAWLRTHTLPPAATDRR